MKTRALLASLIVLAGCSSSSSSGTTGTNTADSGTSGSGTATIDITAPTPNATITLDTGNTMPVSFTTTSFTLMAPNTCAGKKNCGHVHVLIDGDACNDSAGGLPYNVAANVSPATANLSFCASADGDHTLTLELHNDDHTPYLVDGKVVSATEMILDDGPVSRSRAKKATLAAWAVATGLSGIALVEGCDQGMNAAPGYAVAEAGDGASTGNDLCPKIDPSFDSIANDLLGSNTCGATRGGKCHSSGGAESSGGLDYTLPPAAMYAQLLGDGGALAHAQNIAGDDRTLYRVVPGDAGASFLYLKLVTTSGADPRYGSGMPFDHPGELCPAAIEAVKTWIDRGAPFTTPDAGKGDGGDAGISDASADAGTDAGDE